MKIVLIAFVILLVATGCRNRDVYPFELAPPLLEIAGLEGLSMSVTDILMSRHFPVYIVTVAITNDTSYRVDVHLIHHHLYEKYYRGRWVIACFLHDLDGGMTLEGRTIFSGQSNEFPYAMMPSEVLNERFRIRLTMRVERPTNTQREPELHDLVAEFEMSYGHFSWPHYNV